MAGAASNANAGKAKSGHLSGCIVHSSHLTSCAGALWFDLTGRAYILDKKAQPSDMSFV
jgi:hypothetical protein